MKAAIIICSRSESSRIPNKPFQKINGVTIIKHLLRRVMETVDASGAEAWLAVPGVDANKYLHLQKEFGGLNFYSGHDNDPLARMRAVVEASGADCAVRISHDKILIDPMCIAIGLRQFELEGLDYLFTSTMTNGAGFEIISKKALNEAADKFKDVEHISYAIRAVTKNIGEYEAPDWARSDHRLLIDYPKDLELFALLFSQFGEAITLVNALHFLDKNKWAADINRLPLVSVYTCALNAEKWIDKAMGSVVEQAGFRNFEYILVDDASTDNTGLKMAKLAALMPNVKLIRNTENLGLASSSNVAIAAARGKFVIRLDADDYFTDKNALQKLAAALNNRKLDAIYPANHLGNKRTQAGNECHHVGGAMFRRSALNHVKFTDGLRGYEGYDLFLRARSQLKIGYHGEPLFFYRQHPKSMSKTDLATRAAIRAGLEDLHLNGGA